MLLNGGPLPPTPVNFMAFMIGYLLIVAAVRFALTNWRRSKIRNWRQ